MPSLRIGELATESGCAAETIRYYEREGLLPSPVRSAGNYRLYSAAHRARLDFIRNCRALDMTLNEVRALLNIRDLAKDDCSAAHGLLDEHISHVSERIQELQDLERQLKAVRRSCSADSTKHSHCGILDDLGRAVPRLKKRPPHVRGTHKAK